MATVSLLLTVAYTILNLIGCWKVYGKLGEPGWKCLIPIYCDWVEYKYTWKPMMAIWIWLLSLVGDCLLEYCADTNTILALIGIVLTMAAWVLSVIGYYKLSKAFGHGAGFTIGFVLFTSLFQIILGFGKSQYVGNTTEQNEN